MIVPRNSQPKSYLCQYCNICHFETFSQLNEHISSVHPFLSTIIIPGIPNENKNQIQGAANKGEWSTSTFKAQSQVIFNNSLGKRAFLTFPQTRLKTIQSKSVDE